VLGIQAWLETTLAIVAAVVGVLGLAMTVITFISSQVERRAEAKRQRDREAHLEFLAAEATRLKEAHLLAPDDRLIQTFSVQQMWDEIRMQGQNVAGAGPVSPSGDLLLKQRKRFRRSYRSRYRRGIAFMLFSAALLVVLAFI
jgi:hypothetical protein